ncbi:MAG: hypothetical protein AAB456_00245 [Patescibacteria group bacterium]
MDNLKIKIVTGYRQDQHYSIPAEEAHKAYYLFLHPKERGVFSTGIAVRGEDIKSIEPDYNGSMGWHPTHLLEDDDWTEIEQLGIARKLRDILFLAKQNALPEKINRPLLNEARG